MKTMKQTILILMAIVAISLTSCKKDDNGGGGGGQATEGSLIATVEGNGFNSVTAFAVKAGNGGASIITVTGVDANQRTVGLTMNGVTDAGTYAIGGGANIAISGSYIEIDLGSQTTQTWQAPYDSTVVGEVSISSISATNVQGSFSFTAKNVNGDQSLRSVTTGSFNLNFQQ